MLGVLPAHLLLSFSTGAEIGFIHREVNLYIAQRSASVTVTEDVRMRKFLKHSLQQGYLARLGET